MLTFVEKYTVPHAAVLHVACGSLASGLSVHHLKIEDEPVFLFTQAPVRNKSYLYLYVHTSGIWSQGEGPGLASHLQKSGADEPPVQDRLQRESGE